MKIKTLVTLLTLACALAMGVVVLGAYTRLSNAGLGCPDWPGCYGHVMVPSQHQAHASGFTGAVVEAAKAWKEMIHRYAAMTLGLLILGIFVLSVAQRKNVSMNILLPSALVALVCFQGALGRWTVTLKLIPMVVMGHLLGGFSLLALLYYMNLRIRYGEVSALAPYRRWVVIGMAMVALQIALGGWVSANYAGLSCIGFPLCNGQLMPTSEFSQAFSVFSPVGANYEYGVLGTGARATIQMVHRLWAYATAGYLLVLLTGLLRHVTQARVRQCCYAVIALLCVQIGLGILNVLWMLPLTVAVAHNACAALLLLALMTLAFWSGREQNDG